MNRANEHGVVLVAVLLVVAIMSMLVVALTALTRAEIASQHLEDRLFSSRLALRSAIEIAKSVIVSTPPDQRVFFDATPTLVSVEGDLSVEITIRDVSGLVDINRADLRVISALLGRDISPPAANELVNKLKELREKVARPAGKEASPPPVPIAVDQSSQGPSKPGALSDITVPPPVFLSTNQLLAMLPRAALEMEAPGSLSTNFTVFSARATVNPLAASSAILASIPGITDQDIGSIVAARKNREWKSDSMIGSILERLKEHLAIENPSVFMISVRLLNGVKVIPQSRAEVVVQENESGPLPFRTLFVSGL